MEKQCCLPMCVLPVFSDSYNKCALHCEKHDYRIDNDNGLLLAFYNAFLDYLSIGLSRDVDLNAFGIDDSTVHLAIFFSHREEELEALVESNDTSIVTPISRYFNNRVVVFEQIVFPKYNSRDTFDYSKIFKRIAKVHFVGCKFVTSYLPLEETDVFFDGCAFHDTWKICQGSVLPSLN